MLFYHVQYFYEDLTSLALETSSAVKLRKLNCGVLVGSTILPLNTSLPAVRSCISVSFKLLHFFGLVERRA